MSGEKKKITVEVAANRLLALFSANERSCGSFDPASGKVHTVYEGPSIPRWVQHIRGVQGIGCVPIKDDNTVSWAAIDIDNHGQDDDIPIVPVDQKVMADKLPLVLCRSKSGGIHAYAFFKEPIKASRAKGLMERWAAELGFGGSEIFPKQAVLRGTQFGNWINMPYMGGNDTTRYAFRGGKKLSLPLFIEIAEKLRIDEQELLAQQMLDYAQAPPCIQRMITEGVGSGMRNEAMYNTVIYLKRAFPDSVDSKAEELNRTMFEKPLPKAEFKRTVGSASRPDYSYRCGEEPIKSLCDRETCLKRKFGITQKEFDNLGALAQIPEFTDLVKYIAEPVRWEIKINGIRVPNIATPQLLEWKVMREVIAERLTMIVPLIKNQEWERILQDIMKVARIVEVPDDASISGVIRARLREFATKTDLTVKGDNPDGRKAILRGLPAVQVIEGERCVIFRAQDFINYLKRTKSEELKGINLWFAVKDIGVMHAKIRVAAHSANVWYIPVTEVMTDDVEPMTFKSEL